MQFKSCWWVAKLLFNSYECIVVNDIAFIFILYLMFTFYEYFVELMVVYMRFFLLILECIYLYDNFIT
jgi:hypothetical protein